MTDNGMSSRRSAPARAGLLAVILLAPLLWGCDDDENACPPPGMSNCDPVDQRCCAEGEGCVLYYGSTGRFVDACLGGVGEAGEGETCLPNASSGAQGCQPGTTCLQVAGDTGPVCHRVCHDNSDCTEGTCSVELNGVAVRACE